MHHLSGHRVRRRWPVVARTASILLAAGVACPVLLAQDTLAPARVSPSAPTAADVAAGKEIFAAQCALCHGAEGTGGTGPSLRYRTLQHAPTNEALMEVIREGIPDTEMPSFEYVLTDRMLRQTAAYVRSLGRVPAASIPGDARRGADLYRAQGCAACHTIQGAGGVLGPDLTAIGTVRGAPYLRESLVKPDAHHPSEYRVARIVTPDGAPLRGIVLDEDVFWIHLRDADGSVRTIQKTGDMRVEREPEGTLMPSYESRLSDVELTDLVAYLATLRGAR
jgi:cytochrome c oxidase cbb3-type subunit III